MRKTWGQSLVEVAIAFPILIMLFGGVVEFGFMLNTYLSLLDATRESARYWSNDDPFKDDPLHPGTKIDDDAGFYMFVANDVAEQLDPLIRDPDYLGRRIVLDPALDDVIVSVYGADYTATQYRATLLRDAGPYHLFNNGRYQSIFTEQSILATRVCGAPNAGILVVELHYNYYHVLNLPWMTAILPNPLHLQAYTIMPIRAGEPEPPKPAPVPPACP